MPLCTIGNRFARKDQEGEQMFVADWREALLFKHDWDAHVWPYVTFDGGLRSRRPTGDPVPPIRVSSVGGKPALSEGHVALCWLVFLDFDKTADHAGILELFTSRIPDSHYLAKFSAIYPTRSGMRFVYELDSPVLAEEYGAITRAFAFDLALLTGLQVDVSTDQWSRCMRLPSVTRDDEKAKGPTWNESYWFETLVQDEVVPVAEIRPRQDRLPWDTRGRVVASLAGEELPDVDQQLPENRERAYKRAMRVSRFRDYLFADEAGMRTPILEGRRDQMLMAIAGDVVARCFLGVPEASAEEVFLLIAPVALGFAQDGGESWAAKLWRLVRHSWNGEVKKQEERAQKDAAERTQREVVQMEMAKFLPPESLPNDAASRDVTLQRHYCLQTKSGAYVVTPTGEYSQAPLRSHQLPAYFADGLSYLSPDNFLHESGAPMGGTEILNRYSIILDDVIYEPGERASARLAIEGNRKVLKVVPFAIRQDLIERAAYDEEVAAWLGSFRDAALLRKWLASALAVHYGPTAACYLHGPARAGKSMLALALAECFHGQPVPAAQAFSTFNGALLQSPVIMVDEGLPERREGMSTADLFRSLVTGSAISTQRKFEDQASSRIPYRIIFGANSFDMVQQLIGSRSLNAQDREALRERILVIDTGEGPAQYLDKNGAMEFTKDSPKGAWIGGAQRLARHLIHLYLEAYPPGGPVKREGRMLVQGRLHAGFTLAFDLSGSGRTVIDDLVRSLGQMQKRTGVQPALMLCMEVEDNGRVWIKKRPFVKQMVGSISNSRQEEAYSKALDRFLTGVTRPSPIDSSTQHEVDVGKVAYCGDSEGLSISHLTHFEAARTLARS